MEVVLGDLGRILVICGGAALVLLTAILMICCLAPKCWIYRCMHKSKKSELLANVELRRKALYGDEVVLAEFPHDKRVSSRVSSGFELDAARQPGGYLQDVYRQTSHHPAKRTISAASSTSSAYSSQRSGSGSNRSSVSYSQRGSTLSSVSECSEFAHAIEEAARQNGECEPGSMTYASDPHNSTPRLSRDSGGEGGINPYVAPPQVSLNLHLTPSGGTEVDQSAMRLIITVNAASYLPPRQYGTSGSVDAFLHLRLVRQSDAKIPMLEVKTRSVRRSSNPEFEETFQAEIRRADLKDTTLEVTAYDQDRHANPTELSHGKLALAAMFDLLTSLQPQQVNLSMQPSNKVLGEILLSAVYLPTAQRVTLSVVKARGLVFEGSINPYVRIILLSSLGRSIKRKKTSYKLNSSAPSFNENLSFDVMTSQLENLTFLVTVCHKAGVHHSTSDESGSENEAIKDACIGKVAIGKNVRGTAQRLHWLSVLENPRKVISHWHALH